MSSPEALIRKTINIDETLSFMLEESLEFMHFKHKIINTMYQVRMT